MTIPEGHRYEATRALRQALNRAVASELLDYNPAKQGVKNPLRRSLEKRPFDSWVETEAVATQLGPRAAQVNHLEAGLAGDDYGVCLYPLPEVLASDARISRLAKEPYRQQLAEGRGSLDLAFFKIEVLEAYRNDPTFDFRFDDSGADLVVTDEVYGVEGTSDDHISLRLGFAYGDVADDAPLVRRVCVFLSDLAKLTPVHQQRWRTTRSRMKDFGRTRFGSRSKWVNGQMAPARSRRSYMSLKHGTLFISRLLGSPCSDRSKGLESSAGCSDHPSSSMTASFTCSTSCSRKTFCIRH